MLRALISNLSLYCTATSFTRCEVFPALEVFLALHSAICQARSFVLCDVWHILCRVCCPFLSGRDALQMLRPMQACRMSACARLCDARHDWKGISHHFAHLLRSAHEVYSVFLVPQHFLIEPNNFRPSLAWFRHAANESVAWCHGAHTELCKTDGLIIC